MQTKLDFIRKTGLTYREIADYLFVEESTVKSWFSSRRSSMSAPTWELAKIVFNHPDSNWILKPQVTIYNHISPPTKNELPKCLKRAL